MKTEKEGKMDSSVNICVSLLVLSSRSDMKVSVQIHNYTTNCRYCKGLSGNSEHKCESHETRQEHVCAVFHCESIKKKKQILHEKNFAYFWDNLDVLHCNIFMSFQINFHQRNATKISHNIKILFKYYLRR